MTKADRMPPPLAPFKGEPVSAPDWFRTAQTETVDTGFAERDGTRLAWKAWGERGKPGLLLVHGGTAHKGLVGRIGPLSGARRGRSPGRRR